MISNVLIVVASLVVVYVVLVGMALAIVPFMQGASRVANAMLLPFSLTTGRIDSGGRRRQLLREAERELGLDLTGNARADVMQAARDAQRIRVLDQLFRTTVSKCVRTHWAVAEGLGATHMSEAARDPMCQGLRQRVIDLSEVLSDTIAEYPLLLDAPELVRLQVGLRRIAPTCVACPYWTSTMSTAPRLCPPARALDCDGTRPGHVIDAQVLPSD
jgi:hypothetical protein